MIAFGEANHAVVTAKRPFGSPLNSPRIYWKWAYISYGKKTNLDIGPFS